MDVQADENSPGKPRRGRPRKDHRNAAVFLALFWRQDVLGESSNAAQEWVRQRWRYHGLGADRKDVRDAKRFAKERGLKHSLIFPVGGGWMAIETAGSKVTEGARAWIWHPDFHEAAEARVKDPRVEWIRERLEVRRAPVSQAAFALMQG